MSDCFQSHAGLGSSLPDPSGPSSKVPATSIVGANKEVDASRNSNGGKWCREPYVIVTPEQTARVGKSRCRKWYN